jgi:hypothetical protein
MEQKKPPLTPPLDVSRITNEKGVKQLVKRLLDLHGWFYWMPAANGYGTQGVHDFNAIKDGVFLTVETKFSYNKPKPTQSAFAAHVMANSGIALCVNEKNIDHLAWWLESFQIATEHQMRREEVPAEHGARMLNALTALTQDFGQ